MSELQVPDFKHAVDFQNWVSLLDKGEIQSWTSKDWNNMYDKLNAFIARSPELDDDFIAKYGSEARQWPKDIVQAHKRKMFMESPMNTVSMAKLNGYYRPEKYQSQIMENLADNVGKEMATVSQKYKGYDLASVNILSYKNEFNGKQYVWALDNIVYKQTEIPKKLAENNMDANKYRVINSGMADDLEHAGGFADMQHHEAVLSEAYMYEKQNRQFVTLHELVHLQLEQVKDIGQSGKVLPIPELGEDFYKLMQNNFDFYVDPDKVNEIAEKGYARFFEENSLEGFMGYEGQPVEYYSNKVAKRAVNTYQEITGQKSEKGAGAVADYLEKSLGRPYDAFYEGDRINLVYKADNQTLADVEKTINKAFDNASSVLRENLAVSRTEDGITISVTQEAVVQKEIEKLGKPFNKFANMFNLKKKTNIVGVAERASSNVSMHNSQFPAMEGTLKSAAAKLEEKSVEQAVEKTAEESSMQTAKKAAVKASLRAQASSMAVKAAKTAGQATKETLLTVNKAYDKSFDALVKWGNKHSPQWMNRLEEKTVQKAAEKFMKTKSGQAMAKYVEQKIGKEAAASIAKKIPVLCVALVVPSIKERLKEGDFLKAFGEGAAVAAFMVPGPGTLVGLGISGAILMDDLRLFEHSVIQGDPNSHMAAESTFIEKPVIPEKIERKSNQVAEAEKEKKAKQFKANLDWYSKSSSNSWGS